MLKRICKSIHLLFFLAFFMNVSGSELSNNIIVTSSGSVEAYEEKGIYIWKDIPYAKPPINELRWKAPKNYFSTANILPKENNHCVQRSSYLGGIADENLFTGTEDCLYLDIFAPKKSSNKDLAVMFWIHGGANTSGEKDIYNFSKMVRQKNVIVVRINYRLGPFGWFYHPAIQDLQNGIDKTPNFGTLDIIKALEWVQENISKFGGDKNNVTIFGESAGGHNVYSLLVSKQAEGLFHKAISMSGYTTSIPQSSLFKQTKETSTSNHTSWVIVNKILNKKNKNKNQSKYSQEELNKILMQLSAREFFENYLDRKSYEEIPLLAADGIVIPKIGLEDALGNREFLNDVPIIAGSNKDEVKLWLATADYFVDINYSPIGNLLGIPKIVLSDEEAFEAFNYYRSKAWKIRGVDIPLKNISSAGKNSLYSYRFDWDDHRRLIIADFKKLIGAAHATEIPLLAGNSDLIGGPPLSNFIYPKSLSKFYTSKNMIKLWSNFAKNGYPGSSSNGVVWEKFNIKDDNANFLIIDKRRNLKMSNETYNFKDLSLELFSDERLTNREKCVVLLQMFTLVGNDIYDDYKLYYPGECSRKDSEDFLKDNSSSIDY